MILGNEVRYYNAMVVPFPDFIKPEGVKKILQVFCCLACLCPQFVHAIKVPGLYEAETIVSSQSNEGRPAAIRACLGMVLVKLTGTRDVSAESALEPILDQAERFVQQYRYQEIQAEIPALYGPDPAPRWRLAVKFDEENLNNSLRDSGIPVWDKERPSILVWLALERSNRRLFAEAGREPELLAIVQEVAQRRGVSILFPLYDLDDRVKIQPGDVWLGFHEQIMAASARYRADAVLTASVSAPVPGIWEGRWRSYGKDGLKYEWTTETDLLELALEEGFDGFVDALAYEFVHSGSYTQLGDIEITVGAVDSVDQYARLLNYLESLSSVSRIHVKEVRAGEVTLALVAHGGEQAVVQTINLGRTLEPVESPDGHYYLLNP